MKTQAPVIVTRVLVVTAARYFGLGERASLGSTTEGLNFAVIPADCTIRNMTIEYDTGGPGVGTSVEYVIRQSTDAGASWADSSVAETVSGTTTSVLGSTSDTFAAGDWIALETTPVSSPTGRATRVSIEIEVTGQPTWQVILGSGALDSSTSATEYWPSFGVPAAKFTTESEAEVVYPTAGTVSRLFCGISVAAGAGDSYAFTLRHNTASTSCPTATISGASDKSASDTATSPLTVARGDLNDVSVVPSGTPATVRVGWGFVFIPTTAGYSIATMGTANPSNSADQTVIGCGMGSATNLALDIAENAAAGTYRDLYVGVPTAPGAGNSWTVTYYSAGGASALTATVSDAETSDGDTTNTEAEVQGVSAVMRLIPASLPNASRVRQSSVYRVAAAAGPLLRGGRLLTGTMGRRLVG